MLSMIYDQFGLDDKASVYKKKYENILKKKFNKKPTDKNKN